MNKTALIKFLSGLVIFSVAGIVASYINLTSYEIIFVRTLIGGILLVAVYLLTGRKFTFMNYKKDSCFLFLAGLAMGAEWILVYESYRHIGVGAGTLLNYCGPIIVMLLSPIVFNEKLTVKKLVGFAIVVAGALLVNKGITGGDNLKFGIFCGVMSAVANAVMIIFNKRAKHIVGFENATLQLCVCCFTAFCVVMVKNGGAMPVLSAADWRWMLLLSVVNTAFASYLFYSSFADLPAQTISVCSYIKPVSAIFFSALILHEGLAPQKLLGAAMIIGGAWYCTKQK